jgi:predicted transcriptional regulator
MSPSAKRKSNIARLAAIAAARRKSRLSDVEMDILVDLTMHPASTMAEVAARIDRNASTIRRDLANLRKEGLVSNKEFWEGVKAVRFSITNTGERRLQPISLAAA